MDIAEVQASPREAGNSRVARRLRKQALVPAVLYGRQQDNVLLSLHRDELEKLIYLDLVIPTCTIQEAIVDRDLKASQVRDWCGKHGIKPVNRVGQYNRYKVSDLRTVLRALTR